MVNTTITESQRIGAAFAAQEEKVRAAEERAEVADARAEAADSRVKAIEAAQAAAPTELIELRKVALLSGAENGRYTTFCLGLAPGVVDRRHVAAVVLAESIPGDSGVVLASLEDELLFEISMPGVARPLYAAMTETEWASFKIRWGAAHNKGGK